MEGICPRNWETLGGDKFNRVAKLPAGRQGKGEIYMAEITLRNLISPFFFFLSLALVVKGHFFSPLALNFHNILLPADGFVSI